MNIVRVGELAGLAAGTAVTIALRLSRKWNQPLLDGAGRPVVEIPGAERVAGYDLRKRHQEVVGPKIAARAESLPPGPLHDLIAGFGAGATQAPGVVYRLEAKLEKPLQANA